MTYFCSEKARIPAWCDRVLRKGNNLQQIDYNTAPLRFSDHRPVYAIFECTVSVVDERAREAIRSTLYDQRRRGIANKADNSLYGDSDEEDLLDMESIAPGLPPASSDRHKWWLDNGVFFSRSAYNTWDVALTLFQGIPRSHTFNHLA